VRSHSALPLALLFVLVAGRSAGAQACTVNGGAGNCPISISVQMTAPKVVRLTVSPASITLTAPSSTDFDNGYAATTGPAVTVNANTPWTVSMRAGAALWTATNTVPGVAARANKPASDLQWSTSAGGSFTGFTTTNTTLSSGTRTNANLTTLYYRTLYSWTADTPGDYSLAVILTVVAP
jgi:hypothetical protein